MEEEEQEGRGRRRKKRRGEEEEEKEEERGCFEIKEFTATLSVKDSFVGDLGQSIYLVHIRTHRKSITPCYLDQRQSSPHSYTT